MSKTERTEVEGPSDHACAACPWRTDNHRKPHPEGWYSDANRRRLWSGLRTGEAPGMTCHPTDPLNQPVGDSTVTRECAGAWLIIARECDALNKAQSIAAYRKGRKLAMTREGLAVAVSATLPRPLGRGLVINLTDDDGISLGLGTGR
jgi:hypothetical protein